MDPRPCELTPTFQVAPSCSGADGPAEPESGRQRRDLPEDCQDAASRACRKLPLANLSIFTNDSELLNDCPEFALRAENQIRPILAKAVHCLANLDHPWPNPFPFDCVWKTLTKFGPNPC